MDEPIEALSPSGILMHAMEDFSRSEPDDLLLIYTNQDGELVVIGTGGTVAGLGLLAAAKHSILKDA